MRWTRPIPLLLTPFFLMPGALLALGAHADQSALTMAFGEGRYIEAAHQAEASGDADGLSFAARCLLADAMSDANHALPQDLIEEAERLARAALADSPDHIEGRLQLAIALSLRARPLSNREARRSGFGTQARDLAETVLVDDPANTYAHGFMAVWNIEVVRRGGMLGAKVMGASINKARTHYQAAIRDTGGDAATHWQYAKALAALNAQKYSEDIVSALDAALNSEPRSALELVMQTRAGELYDALATLPRREVEALAAQML